jgi:NDP-sugar pyrophosphorylase family protein
MRAVVLAGGRGTRLAPYTTVLPKPLMPVGDMPILELLIRSLARAGITDITLAVGHLSSLLMAYFGDGEHLSVSIDYSLEDSPLGTAGPLRLIPNLDDSFLVMNGDLLTDLDFGAMISAHRQKAATVTVGTYQRDVQIDLGVIEHDQDGRVTRYIEKPLHHFLVSMGVYVVEPAALELIPQGPFDLPDLVATLIASGQDVRSYRHDGYWLDIGRPDDYQKAQEDVASIQARVLARPREMG